MIIYQVRRGSIWLLYQDALVKLEEWWGACEMRGMGSLDRQQFVHAFDPARNFLLEALP